MENVKKYGFLAMMALTTFAFVAAGGMKLSGAEQMHASFGMMGLPIWFGYFIGACEIAGGIGIWVRKLSGLAAAGLFIIMAGAIYFHVNYTPISMAIPALVLAIFAAIIFVKRRKDILK
ncbi:MAG: DoxX family protein [Hyphomicrobiales bacterium]|nr:MAG: DoxX family protein [Hyphomicrobiales bacterium]